MRADRVIALSRWLEKNRSLVVGENLTKIAIGAKAAADLRFKVPVCALTQVLKSHGIETRRRGEKTVKIEMLTEQRARYRKWIIQLIDSNDLKEVMLESMEEDFADDSEISQAARRKIQALVDKTC